MVAIKNVKETVKDAFSFDDETILSAAVCFLQPSDLGPQSEFIEAGIVIDQAPLGQDILVKDTGGKGSVELISLNKQKANDEIIS